VPRQDRGLTAGEIDYQEFGDDHLLGPPFGSVSSEMNQDAIREALQMDDEARGVVPQQRRGSAQHLRQICATPGCGLPSQIDDLYCCRVCALGNGQHHWLCHAQVIVSDPERALEMNVIQPQTDEEYAQRLQYREELMARQHLAHQLSVRIWEAATCLTDPVWGHVEFGAIEVNDSWKKNRRKQVCTSCLFSSCPCCLFTAAWCLRDRMMIKEGATHRDIRTGYRRMLLSWSFLLVIPQLLSVIFQLVVGYTWVAEDGVDFSGDYQHPTMTHQYDAEGAKNAAKIIYWNEWWRLITPIFLHGGWLHFLGNAAVQLRTGMMLEAIWGRHVWLLIYLTSGIMGNVWSCIANPNMLSIGSSSSLSGIIGAWPVFIAITWNQTTPNDRKERDRMMVLVIFALVLLVAFSFMPMVDWAAHFGGMAAGMVVSATWFAQRLQTRSWRLATGVIGALSSLALFVVSMAYMYTSVKPDERLLEL
jgi:membrane associated rhomboid family serine protease